MSDIETGSQSDVSTESATSSETASSAPSQDVGTSQEASAPAQKELPFHEHPRFRELVEQKNQYQNKFDQIAQDNHRLQTQLQQLLQQQTQASKPKDADYSDVFKEIEQLNPNFARFQQELHSKLPLVNQLQEKLSSIEQQMSVERQQRDAATARSEFSRLCTENKVSESDRELYMERVANMANARGSSIKDLPALFTEAHQGLSKYIESVKRSERESYTKQKASDRVPTSATGGVAVGLPSNKGSGSIEDVKAAFTAAMRAKRNI